jgi:hypothetical protein
MNPGVTMNPRFAMDQGIAIDPGVIMNQECHGSGGHNGSKNGMGSAGLFVAILRAARSGKQKGPTAWLWMPHHQPAPANTNHRTLPIGSTDIRPSHEDPPQGLLRKTQLIIRFLPKGKPSGGQHPEPSPQA